MSNRLIEHLRQSIGREDDPLPTPEAQTETVIAVSEVTEMLAASGVEDGEAYCHDLLMAESVARQFEHFKHMLVLRMSSCHAPEGISDEDKASLAVQVERARGVIRRVEALLDEVYRPGDGRTPA